MSYYYSVAAGRKVLFAPGNLQWSATGGGTTATTHAVADGGTAPGTWRFAEHQWDYVGDATNGTVYANGVKCDNSLIDENYTGWIDLFCWATSGWDNGNLYYQPYEHFFQPYLETPSELLSRGYGYGPYNGSNYRTSLTGAYINADWGYFNAISNDGYNEPARWRTLTKMEWNYLILSRSTISGIRYAKAIVNGVSGLIIVPDNWNSSIYTLNSPNTSGANFNINIITATNWDVLEKSGCTFLPTTGQRRQNATIANTDCSYYWTTTVMMGDDAWIMKFDNDELNVSNMSSSREAGNPVRPVRDVD
jgi:hypothetical protein